MNLEKGMRVVVYDLVQAGDEIVKKVAGAGVVEWTDGHIVEIRMDFSRTIREETVNTVKSEQK